MAVFSSPLVALPICLFRASTTRAWRSALLSSQVFFSSFSQILNSRAALLSNYEVLQLLKELEADHIARTRTAHRLKKEEEDNAAATGHPAPPSPDPPLTVSENLRTIEVEVNYAPLTLTSQILTCLTSGHPVPHSRLSTHAFADSPGHPTPDQKPRPLRSHQSRKTPNCQLDPRRACRALCRGCHAPPLRPLLAR